MPENPKALPKEYPMHPPHEHLPSSNPMQPTWSDVHPIPQKGERNAQDAGLGSSTHPTGGKPFRPPTHRHSINIRILLEGESPKEKEGEEGRKKG